MWPRGEIHPFGGGGGGKEVSHKEHIRAILDITGIVFCPATLSFPGHLPASKNLPEEQIF